MAGYRGDGYGGNDDRGGNWSDGARGGGRESYWNREEGSGRREDSGKRLTDDPRAVEAADDWRRRFGREGYQGSYGQHDEAYRSFRERHIEELDRDYADWCREQERQSHQDYESWRQQRASGPGFQGKA